MNKFLKIFAFAGAVLAFGACQLTKDEPEDKGGETGLVIEADKYVLTSNGVDGIVLTVKLDGKEVPIEDVNFYDAESNKKMDMPDGYFQTTESGPHSFWASYSAQISPAITVYGISSAIPQLPEDSAPESVDFARKVLITQFTGTACSNCPRVITMLKSFMSSPYYAEKAIWTACHRYNSDDPAYLNEALNTAVNVNSYPWVVLDMNASLKTSSGDVNVFSSMFDKEYEAEKAKAALSAVAILDEDLFIVKAGVKAAEDGEFRVAMWLLEDGIVGAQAGGDKSFNTHNNCIRLVQGKNGNRDYSGKSFNLTKGQSDEQISIFKLTPKMVAENCHVVVMVSTKGADGRFYVNNAIDCPLDGSVAYSYNK